MNILPAQGVTYPPQDTVCLACAQDIWVMLEYRDAQGVVGQRWMCRGTWPLTTTALLGYRFRDGATGLPSALQDLDTLSAGQSPWGGRSSPTEGPSRPFSVSGAVLGTTAPR